MFKNRAVEGRRHQHFHPVSAFQRQPRCPVCDLMCCTHADLQEHLLINHKNWFEMLLAKVFANQKPAEE
jgi:hypothetical protein